MAMQLPLIRPQCGRTLQMLFVVFAILLDRVSFAVYHWLSVYMWHIHTLSQQTSHEAIMCDCNSCTTSALFMVPNTLASSPEHPLRLCAQPTDQP
eukprot:1153275-Pelagomonas_calceolata.AAC.2